MIICRKPIDFYQFFIINGILKLESIIKKNMIIGLAIGGTVLVVKAVLGAIGFVPTGIAASSLAAVWMSKIGIVSAGSLFSILQAAAMTLWDTK